MNDDTKKRKAALEEAIKKNPHSSTIEREQLAELEKQEQEEKLKPKDVLY